MESSKRNSQVKFLIFIAVLRCLASCLITNTHYNNVYPTEAFAIGGLIGDVLFFAISGYCLRNVRGHFLKWYGKRFVRIYLPVCVITAVYMVLGVYKLEGKDFIWWFLFPTNYHFVASIMILYIPFYILCSIKQLEGKTPYIMLIVGVLYFLVYFLFYDKSYYHIDYIQEPMVWFLFFEAMLLGAYMRDKTRNNAEGFKLLWVLLVALFAMAYFASKILIAKISSLVYLQFITQVSLLGFIFCLFIFVASLEKVFEKTPQKIQSVIVYLSKLTLEIYIVQKPIIAFLENLVVFPLNWIIVTVSILLAAIVLHLICDLIIKGFKLLIDKIFKREKLSEGS